MFDLGFLVGVSNSLKGWFDSLRGMAKDFNQEEKDAFSSFYKGVNETRIYIGSMHRVGISKLQHEEKRDYAEEARLSRLWVAASRKLAPFNADLAEKCFVKGDYCTTPEAWSSDDVKRARIEIDRMFDIARKLIRA